MTLDDFTASLSGDTPPPALPASLAAMWNDGKGDWKQAHNIAQDIPTREGSWVHAYLHRKEGDSGNANYWYNAQVNPCRTIRWNRNGKRW